MTSLIEQTKPWVHLGVGVAVIGWGLISGQMALTALGAGALGIGGFNQASEGETADA